VLRRTPTSTTGCAAWWSTTLLLTNNKCFYLRKLQRLLVA